MLLNGDFDLQHIIFLIVSIVIGFSVHEFAHAAVAHLLGDNTPERQGRLTLSPHAHIDIAGFLMFLLAGFGWAKPVQVTPSRFKNPLRDDLLVSLAGPASNFLLAVLFAKLFFFPLPEAYRGLVETMVETNVILTVFNLLPIPPLDGSRIIHYFLPASARSAWAAIEQYSFLLFAVLVFAGVTDLIMNYPVSLVMNIAYLGLPT